MARRTQWLLAVGSILLATTLDLTLTGSRPALLAHPSARESVSSSGDRVCPLTEQQEVEAPKAFAAMMPTFTHPRCLNCHGGVNPFEPNTRHVSGRVGKQFKEISIRDDILEKDITLVEIDEKDRWARCADCHSSFQGEWKLAPPVKWFVGKNTLQLCMQNKQFATADAFLAHIQEEQGSLDPFIDEAFKGTRGLDENGQATYQNITGKDYQLEPPPITHAQLNDQAKVWVEAMGGEFTGGWDCGCRPHKYALELSYHLLHEGRGAKLASDAKAILPLKFVKFKEFVAEGSTELIMSVSLHTANMDCKDSFIRTNPHWQATGTVGGPDFIPNSKLEIRFTLSMPPGYIAPQTCTAGKITSTTPGAATAPYEAHALPPVELEANVGSTTSIPQGPDLKLDVKLIEQ